MRIRKISEWSGCSKMKLKLRWNLDWNKFQLTDTAERSGKDL